MINVNISKKVFNDAYLPFLDNDDRYLIIFGGGSSGKSYFIAQRWIYMLLNQSMNLLIVRQTANSNRNSTFQMMKQIISKWNLEEVFTVNKSDLKIINNYNKNEVSFAGLDDVEKIKSITFGNGELTHIWVEEATETTRDDINQLKIRLRGGISKKQMVLSFNPVDINHWIKKDFIDNGLATVLHTTYKDNKFLTKDDIKTLEDFKETDEYYYNVYCLGNWGVLGKSYFDGRKVSIRLSEIGKPMKKGYFVYEDDGFRITNQRWINSEEGYISIYETPLDSKYAIGGDTAGEGSDYFTGQVLDAKTGKQVATLRHSMDADLYAKQMYCLGVYYNEALIGIESNFDSYPIRTLERYGYMNMYIRERADTFTHNVIKSFGFRTTSITRPLILSELVKIVREETYNINDKDTLEEMLTFIRNERGRAEAANGAHDDLIMALAIAYKILEQVDLTQEPIEMGMNHSFSFEKSSNLDFGEQIIEV